MVRDNALEWIKRYTNDRSLKDEGGIAIILDKMELWYKRDGATSKSVSRYSVSYNGDDLPDDIIRMLKSYKKLRVV